MHQHGTAIADWHLQVLMHVDTPVFGYIWFDCRCTAENLLHAMRQLQGSCEEAVSLKTAVGSKCSRADCNYLRPQRNSLHRKGCWLGRPAVALL